MSKPSTWTAPKDDAPLTVVVQRVQAARTTAAQVERLLATTLADKDSVWPTQTQLSAGEIARVQKQIAEHPYYDGTSLSVSSAIVWADELASIHNETGTNPSLLAALSPDIGAGYRANGAFRRRRGKSTSDQLGHGHPTELRRRGARRNLCWLSGQWLESKCSCACRRANCR